MRKFIKSAIVLPLLCCFCLGLTACGGPSDEEIKAVREVSFEGTELTVTLGTNKSTGYEWEFEIQGECIEQSINNTFKITGSEGEGTGEVSIGFEGKSEGTAVIVFTTPNGWDGTGEGDGYTVNVEVAADGSIVSAVGEEGVAAPKTSVTIEELAEGTYTGTMQGEEYSNEEETVFTTVSPADISATIENGQITLSCDAVANAYGIIGGEKTPPAPEGSITFSGTLPLQQSGDTVTAEGEIPVYGKFHRCYFSDSKFTRWELIERTGESKYSCTVVIAMENGVPVATINVKAKMSDRTATVPLQLKDAQ